MSQENPYRSPSTPSKKGSFPARHCPSCRLELTFGVALRQPTPFRFHCPACRSNYRVETPGMGLLFVAVIVLTFVYVLAAAGAIAWLGFRALALVAVGAVAGFLILELLTHLYISRWGRLLEDPRGPRR